MDSRTSDARPSEPSTRECDEDGDRYVEVWDGVRVVSPFPNNQHQRIATRLSRALLDAIEDPGLGVVLTGTNVSDRHEDWRYNYRGPDIAVYLSGTSARDWETHWEGGPDFAVEIVSPQDHSRQKLGFFASVGVREVLIIDRYPWALELYQLRDGVLTQVGMTEPGQQDLLASVVLPLRFRLDVGTPRPTIEVIHVDGIRAWTI